MLKKKSKPKNSIKERAKLVPKKVKNKVNLHLELLDLGFKTQYLDDEFNDDCFWFEKEIKTKNFNYKIVVEDDYPFISLQIEVYTSGILKEKHKTYEDIYRYLGKVTIDKVKEVIKMIN